MSSESDEEDLALYGTPLEPLNEDEVPKKRALTVADQIAKDKHGRRRFHGAFTGGFSAGFFNTVGSLEGWKPTQFASSRTSRSKTHQQSAEDFMDDEDLGEFGIAPKTLQPRNDYNQGGESRKRSLMNFSEGPIPGIPVLKTLIEPVRETIGVRLLMKMGWKSGQGVGPRLSKLDKSLSKKGQRSVKMYGCTLPPSQGEQVDNKVEDSSDDDSDGDVLEDITFAPDDYEPYLVKPKDNCFGLGYSGLNRKPVLSSHVNLFEPAGPSLIMEEKKKKVSIRGQAFGVGAFEREDDDIYANEDMSQYDFALDTPKMMAEKRLKERNSRLALPSSSSEVLEGFVMVSQPVVQKSYPPPRLPQGFLPRHCTKQSRFSSAPDDSTARHQSRLTANERGVLVNTDQPQRAVSSTHSLQPAAEEASDEPVTVENTPSTFRPFVADPEKQSRYEKFLTLTKLGQSEKLKSLQPLNMTEWEAERERAEFEQAAKLYRPLSAAFSDRFVTASQPDDATDPLAPVARTVAADQDVVNAAKLKMFGRLTRRIGDWHPHSTLCKRFNIPQPGRSTSSMSTKTSRPKFSIFNFLDAVPFNNSPGLREDVDKTTPPTDSDTTPSVTLRVSDVKPNTHTATDDDIEKLAESTNKMDLYKAIFLSSSDESDEDEKQVVPVQKDTSQTRGIFANLEVLNSPAEKLEKTAKEINILRNTSPPRGIFANIDCINTKSTKTQSSSSVLLNDHDLPKLPQDNTSINSNQTNFKNTEQKPDNGTRINSNSDETSVYGPSLPQTTLQPKVKSNCHIKGSSSESEEWVEQGGDKSRSDSSDTNHRHVSKRKHKKKSHRKSKKHKEKKHKYKKKRSK